MLKRTLILLAISSLALQASNGAVSPFDLYDEAYKLVDDLKISVNRSYITASNRLIVHVQEVQISINSLKTASNAQVDLSYATVQQQLQAIKNQYATNSRLDVCLEGREALLPEILQESKDHLVVCLVTHSDDIRSRLNQATGALNSINNRVSGVEQQLVDCGRTDVLCIAEIVGLVPDLTDTLPRLTITVANNATIDVDNTLFDLERCTIQDVSAITNLGTQILNSIRACIVSSPNNA